MATLKELRLAEKAAIQQRQVVLDLQNLVKSIERCEKTIVDLKNELETVNQKYPARRTTQEDIAYLTELLKCANKKLAWEKHLASLQKRTGAVLQEMTALLKDPQNPPGPEMHDALLRALEGVQAAMNRLEQVKL